MRIYFSLLIIFSVGCSGGSSGGNSTSSPTVNTPVLTIAPSNLHLSSNFLVTTAGVSFPNISAQNDGGTATFSIQPSLPNGLSLNTSTGAISGIATTSITQTTFIITATNSAGATTTSISLTVLAPELVSAGVDHVCAVISGVTKCWGHNTYGQLGTGDTSDRLISTTISSLSNTGISVSSGNSFSCALNMIGGIKCWGINGYGQLTNGNTSNSSLPVSSAGFSSGIAKIVAGGNDTCILLQSGTVKCVGYNAVGTLGNGTTADSSAFVDVIDNLSNAISNIVDISIRDDGASVCAVQFSGKILCWGLNTSGQLGNGTLTNTNVAVAVSGISSGATRVSVGGMQTCAIISGAVKCWGQLSNGSLGTSSTGTGNFSSPQSISVPGSVTDISVEGGGCAVNSLGAEYCWGAGGSGANGNNSTSNAYSPTLVYGGSSGTFQISRGVGGTCSTSASGSITCWGAGLYGQLANNSTSGSLVPSPTQ